MNSTIKKLYASILYEIPLPEILNCIEFQTESLFKDEKEIWILLSKIIPVSIENNLTNIKEDLSKIEIIYELLEVIWKKRYDVKEKLIQFKLKNQQLIEYLMLHQQSKSLEIIDKIDQIQSECYFNENIEFFVWEDLKLMYIKQVLYYAYYKNIIIPEFIYSIKLQTQKYSIIYSKELTKQLKQKELYKRVSKQNELPDEILIIQMLTRISNQDCKTLQDIIQSQYMQDLCNQITSQHLSDEISMLIIKIQQKKNHMTPVIYKPGKVRQMKDSIRQKLLDIYLKNAIDIKLALPELLSCFQHHHRRNKKLIILNPNQHLFNCVDQYNELAELNKKLKIQEFFARIEKTVDQLNTFMQYLQENFPTQKKDNYQIEIQEIIELIYSQRQQVRQQLLQLYSESKFQIFVSEFQEQLKLKDESHVNQWYYRCGGIVLELSNFIHEESKTQIRYIELQEITKPVFSKFQHLDLSKEMRATARKNILQIIRVLLSLNKPEAEFLRYVVFKGTKCKDAIVIRITNLLILYISESKRISVSLEKMINKFPSTPEQFSQFLCNQQIQILQPIPYKIQNGSEKQLIFELILSCYENRIELEYELKSLLKTNELQYLLQSLRTNFQNSRSFAEKGILNNLERLFSYFWNQEENIKIQIQEKVEFNN